ncbi:MAG: TaqI-like C-terminal specificity domain-containing protein [Candidatus Methanomethylophilus sp.]|nr:TaqI-like C-terminal specificity domain-containing protein [Methanomethylophilus sp.]
MNEAKFKILIENFSPTLLAETFQKSHDLFRIKQDLILTNKNEKFTDIVQLGDFMLEDNANILVVSVKALPPLSERSGRKNQYDIAKKILKDNPRYNAGIFVYYDSKGDFRMSLIYAEYLGIKVDYSTFKRFTYFVSKEQKNITFIQQVSPFNFTNLTQLKELFSVEKVTKEFFKKYHDLFIDTLEDFEKNEVFQNTVVKTNISTSSDFVKKMMGQIVFLYFVQKKGWLGVRPNENWGSGDQAFFRTLFAICEKSNKNYFNDYLEPLFYKALAEERGDDDFFQELNCRIPFLNGGLFESVYDWQNTTIYIPNKTIGNLLDFFDQYNFTVDENIPSDQEISVDPEMLGKIFENLLEVKDRKDKGAFYTPREIVHYMCRESLIQHLVLENTAPEERIRKLFENKDTDLSVLTEDERRTEAIKKMSDLKDIAEKVDISLRNVKIVDPAVGSGAFPMGMLNEISSVRFYLNSNFLHKLNIGGKELSLYDIKKETLENCIYAVDIEPGAVEIAKLRFWLALVVEYESNDLKIAPPTLPNLDYKIMQGNSLLEEYEGVKLFNEKIIENIDYKENQIIEIKQKQWLIQEEYLDLRRNNKLTPAIKFELDDKAKKLNERLKKLNQVDKVDVEKIGFFDFDKNKESKLRANELKSLQKQFFETNNKEKKESIKKEIDGLEWELIEATLKEKGEISELNKIKKFKKSKVKPFFLWKLHFADVFEQKGGFDIAIGNPPYIQLQKAIEEGSSRKYADIYKDQNYKTFERTGDIYCLFYEKGINLLRKNGLLIFITSNKWMRSGYGKSLREYFISKNPKILIDLGGQVFDSATVDTNVLLIGNEENKEETLAISVKDKKKDLEDQVKSKSLKVAFTDSNGWFIGSLAEINLKKKIEQIGKPLKNWGVKINRGILTGFNEAFIINKKIRDQLIAKDPKSIEIIKPILRGRDIKRYSYKFSDLYILTTGHDLDIPNLYPAIYNYLLKFKKVAEKRQDQGKNWWNLRPCTYYEEFKKEKIVWGNISYDSSFTLLEKDIFLNAPGNLITSDVVDLKFLIGCLNSKIFNWEFKQKGIFLGKAYEWKKQYVEEVHIPIINNETIKSKIKELVILIQEKKNNNINANIDNIESQIDQLFYDFYDLNQEEKEIVENSTKKLL